MIFPTLGRVHFLCRGSFSEKGSQDRKRHSAGNGVRCAYILISVPF
nr:MAG TPA: hypothetical protein [Caudoviricetes sp.]DAO88875.1 MAG TPA: hypothetical protein [Caudoviricetes sp.]DAY40007.1 MAG TPA: hypothetical protein [Bacteriophage sp.]